MACVAHRFVQSNRWQFISVYCQWYVRYMSCISVCVSYIVISSYIMLYLDPDWTAAIGLLKKKNDWWVPVKGRPNQSGFSNGWNTLGQPESKLPEKWWMCFPFFMGGIFFAAYIIIHPPRIWILGWNQQPETLKLWVCRRIGSEIPPQLVIMFPIKLA